MDLFDFLLGAVAVLALPFPLEAKLVGWRALAEVALVFLLGLLAYEWFFSEFRKLPFTCSRLTGKKPLWITFLYGVGLLTAFPVAHKIVVETLYSGAAMTAVTVGTIALWRRVHAARRTAWSDLRLTYDEAPDPAIEGLNLLR